jgi:hypothetical protein
VLVVVRIASLDVCVVVWVLVGVRIKSVFLRAAQTCQLSWTVMIMCSVKGVVLNSLAFPASFQAPDGDHDTDDSCIL